MWNLKIHGQFCNHCLVFITGFTGCLCDFVKKYLIYLWVYREDDTTVGYDTLINVWMNQWCITCPWNNMLCACSPGKQTDISWSSLSTNRSGNNALGKWLGHPGLQLIRLRMAATRLSNTTGWSWWWSDAPRSGLRRTRARSDKVQIITKSNQK